MPTLTPDDIRARLKSAIVKKGGITKFAASRDVTESYIYRVLKTGRPSAKLASFLGVREIRGTWEDAK